MNTLHSSQKIYSYDQTVSPQHLIILKEHIKQLILMSNYHSILLLNNKNESMSYVSCIFLQVLTGVSPGKAGFPKQNLLKLLKRVYSKLDIHSVPKPSKH